MRPLDGYVVSSDHVTLVVKDCLGSEHRIQPHPHLSKGDAVLINFDHTRGRVHNVHSVESYEHPDDEGSAEQGWVEVVPDDIVAGYDIDGPIN